MGADLSEVMRAVDGGYGDALRARERREVSEGCIDGRISEAESGIDTDHPRRRGFDAGDRLPINLTGSCLQRIRGDTAEAVRCLSVRLSGDESPRGCTRRIFIRAISAQRPKGQQFRFRQAQADLCLHDASGAAVEFSHHEFDVTERLRCSQPAVGRLRDTVDERIARLIDRHFSAYDTRDVDIDMFGH